MVSKNKLGFSIAGSIVVLAIIFRFCCGIFVIQPLGVLPEGATIVYWRVGLNIPFIASADGILEKSGQGVSLMGRIITLGSILEPIQGRKIMRLGYSDWLYMISTSGNRYEQ